MPRGERSRSGRARLLVASLVLAVCAGACGGITDEFPGYDLWMTNESQADVIVVLMDGPDVTRASFVYTLPADGSLRTAYQHIARYSADGIERGIDKGVVYVYDSDCRRLLGQVAVPLGTFEFRITPDGSIDVHAAPSDATRPGADHPTNGSIPSGCPPLG